jgi:hypothetical protein
MAKREDYYIGKSNELNICQCNNCINNNRDEFVTCKAFLSGIPENILTGEFDHTKKHPEQDNDILFEEIKG